ALAAPGAPVAIVGGGFIGLEVASSLAELGLRPTVIEMAPTLWSGGLGTDLGAWAGDRLREAGVVLRLASSVTRLADGAVWVGDERIPAAFVVAGIGVRPRDALGVSAGLVTGDGIVVDDQQRTSHPAIWAAGDVARVSGRRVEHWHAAREAGERAALSMLGLPVSPPPPPWVFSEIGGATLDLIGVLDAWEAQRWLIESRLLAYLAADRVVGLASMDGLLAPETARDLVAAAASVPEVMASVP
ncbi:MAG: NAD(P)/FAD-dependent oxidoreductase, partial [Chloroflexota bacterium]|nr:NAD(P)/FAD-dependent oxidoreductase [Chloroflexota bacterium]